MILLKQNKQEYNNDIRAMIMAFYPGIKIVEDASLSEDFLFTFRIQYGEGETILTVCKHAMELLKDKEQGKRSFDEDGNEIEEISADGCDKPDELYEVAELPLYSGKLFISPCGYRAKLVGDYRDKQSFRNLLKIASYRLIGQLADKRLPWGDMTGVRPTKVAMKNLKDGMTFADAVCYYQDVYDVSERKAKLATRVADCEMQLVEHLEQELKQGIDDKDMISSVTPLGNAYCLYVGIPFCPSRCLYCSFTSYPIARYEKVAEDYIAKLCQELDYIADVYKHKKLVAIYVGGGTPTAINHNLLDILLTKIENVFCLDDVKEFTVEAGRPDSFTIEKLQVMKKHHVSRISINPQTMNDETLKTIGRAHTVQQAKDAFAMARAEGFDNINMDLIAGLPGETLESMQNTLNQIKELGPESLTVHSLAIKRAANLKQQMSEFGDTINQDMNAMLDLVSDVAAELGMGPYYLYRQKNIGGNLENVGYAKPGLECLYNVLIMEELTDIIAAGAGASTKLVYHAQNRVERVENCKSVEDYIGRFDEMIARKEKNL